MTFHKYKATRPVTLTLTMSNKERQRLNQRVKQGGFISLEHYIYGLLDHLGPIELNSIIDITREEPPQVEDTDTIKVYDIDNVKFRREREHHQQRDTQQMKIDHYIN